MTRVEANRWSPVSLFTTAAAVLILTLLTITSAHATISAADTVRHTIDEVLVTLTDPELDENGRKSVALKRISAAFDFTRMSQRILASNWSKASVAQRSRFVELFSRILANTYWQRIKSYSDQQIDIVGESAKNQNLSRVKTLIRAATQNIPMDYSLRLKDGRWLAYDVIIEGVSLVNNYRSSYQQIARQDGLDDLLKQMEKKVSEHTN